MNRRWILTYFGGKDSIALVVLALSMKQIHTDIDLHVTYSDTLMEIPQMSSVSYGFLDALRTRYPAKIKIVTPRINETYWVRMIT